MGTCGLHHEIAGEGEPVVLLHPGFADSRIWDPQRQPYAERFRVVRCDMRGFGRSPIVSMPITHAPDIAALLDQLGIAHAAFVGCSLGGRVALELALSRPDLVAGLVLAGATTPEALAMAPEMAAHTSGLMEAIGRRDLDAAVEVSVRTWVDGPHRVPAQVDADLRAKVASMQRGAFINTREFATSWREDFLVTELAERLGNIHAPTLVVVGELDMGFIRDQAHVFAAAIQGARLVTLAGTAHAPSIERPAAFNDVVVPFLETARPGTGRFGG